MHGQTDAVLQPRRSAVAGPRGRLIHAVDDGRMALQPVSSRLGVFALFAGPFQGARSLRRHCIDMPAMNERKARLTSDGSREV